MMDSAIILKIDSEEDEENVLMEQSFVKNPDLSIRDLLTETIAKLGENISISRFSRFQLGETQSISENRKPQKN